MKAASPWEIYLPPAEHRRREIIRTVVQDDIDEMLRECCVLPFTEDQIRSLIREKIADAVKRIPDPDGFITPLPQNPHLDLVSDPYGLDADYLLNTQQEYEFALIRRQDEQRLIDPRTRTDRNAEVCRHYATIRRRQQELRRRVAQQLAGRNLKGRAVAPLFPS